jgi:hypothetical protein
MHTTTTTTSSSSTGGSPPASCANATAISFGKSQAGDLSTTGQVDYYAFTGKAGQAVDIYTQAQGKVKGAAFDPTWIDTVVTLFDSGDKQIAENNDRVPRGDNDSELITLLPADGTYCVRVEECWTWASNPASTCAGTADKANTSYSFGVNLIDPTRPGNVKDVESAGNTPNPITYEPVTGGTGCYLSLLYGSFTGPTDADVFSFGPPPQPCAPVIPGGARSAVFLYVLPAGTSGNGSTTPVGNVYLVDAADPAQNHIAELSATNYQGYARLWVPLDLTKQYTFSIEHPAGSAGSNDFYVTEYFPGSSNYVEVNDAANDTIAGAEMPPKYNGAGTHYYIDGDMQTDADIDWWEVPVGTNTMLDVSCAAQREGSGVRGLRVDAVDAAMTSTALGTAIESPTAGADTHYQTIATGVTHVGVKISTTMPHDPNVTSTYYHCGIHLQ